MNVRSLVGRTRGYSPDEEGESPFDVTLPWEADRSAAIICDMWDTHHCVSAARRVAEMAPRMDEVVRGLRGQGTMIVHAPSSCMEFYSGSAARRRAKEAAPSRPRVEIDWNDWNPDREEVLPSAVTNPGPCSCETVEPCCGPEPPYPWTRQISSILVEDRDAVSDDGHEVYNVLRERGISDVLVMGVHTNLCVLGRPFGIRQLVYLGLSPVLCRDLTDAFHRLEGGHTQGTGLVVEHIERFWCPTITSDQLVGGVPFSFG